MNRTEIVAELADLHAKPSLLASEQRRVDFLERRLAEADADDGLEQTLALRREHLSREAEMYGYATTDLEEN